LTKSRWLLRLAFTRRSTCVRPSNRSLESKKQRSSSGQ
jgi:hypothetical protein